MPPRCQDLAIPLTACSTASVEGSRPLKMISFWWSHIALSVAKMVCHFASRRKGPWTLIDCQKASPAVTLISPRAAAVQTGWTSGHSKNKWEQSSVAPEHITHPSTCFWNKALPQGARHQAAPYEKPAKNLDLQRDTTSPQKVASAHQNRILRRLRG